MKGGQRKSLNQPSGNGKRKKLCRTRLAILLNARYTQTSETMSFESALPGEELFHRELVGAASLRDRDLAAPHRGNHRRLATDYPSSGVRSGQGFRERCSGQCRTGRVFHQPARDAERLPSKERDLPIGEPGRRASFISARSLFTISMRKSRHFHAFFTIKRACHDLFRFFYDHLEIGLANGT